MLNDSTHRLRIGKATIVFVSYCRKNTDTVNCILNLLIDWRITQVTEVFRDVVIPPSANWEHELNAKLINADVFLAFISPEYLGSEWCMAELEILMSNSRRQLNPIQPILVIISDEFGQEIPDSIPRILCPSIKSIQNSSDYRDQEIAKIRTRLKLALCDAIISRHDNWIKDEEFDLEYNELDRFVLEHGVERTLSIPMIGWFLALFLTEICAIGSQILVTYWLGRFSGSIVVGITIAAASVGFAFILQSKWLKRIRPVNDNHRLTPKWSKSKICMVYIVLAGILVGFLFLSLRNFHEETSLVSISVVGILTALVFNFLANSVYGIWNTVKTLQIFEDSNFRWYALNGWCLYGSGKTALERRDSSYDVKSSEKTSHFIESVTSIDLRQPTSTSPKQNISQLVLDGADDSVVSDDDDYSSILNRLAQATQAILRSNEASSRIMEEYVTETAGKIVKFWLVALELDEKSIETFRTALNEHPLSRKVATGRLFFSDIHCNLEKSDVYLLFVSKAFCTEASEIIQQLSACPYVFPILLDECDYYRAGVGNRQAVPIGGIPVSQWNCPNEAYQNIVYGIFGGLKSRSFPHPTWFEI